MALPSIDNVPTAYLTNTADNKPLEMPTILQSWLTNLVDTMNEALLQIDKRLTAGGL